MPRKGIYDNSVKLLLALSILKKKKNSEKKSSENDQSTGHFQSFFIFIFFVPRP